MKRWQALLDARPNIVAILLAAGGNVLGNVVTDQVPPEAKRQAAPALAVVLLTLFVVSLLRRSLTGGRSRARTWAALVLLLVYEGLWPIGGLVSNVVAANLPPAVHQYAALVYPVLVIVALLIAVLDFLTQRAPPVEATNRRNFLTKLQTRYDRRQEDALRGAIKLDLGLHEAPEMVTQPALMMGTLTETHQLGDAHPVSAGTPIGQVYEAVHRQLLILGEPGAGKTTLLVDLGLALLKGARSGATLPMPVVFNLATWATNRLPLTDWFVEDLEYTYQVPKRVARAWLETDAVLPLLDGLDEIPDLHTRDGCVEAINLFHAAHEGGDILTTPHASPLLAYRSTYLFAAVRLPVALSPREDTYYPSCVTPLCSPRRLSLPAWRWAGPAR